MLQLKHLQNGLFLEFFRFSIPIVSYKTEVVFFWFIVLVRCGVLTVEIEHVDVETLEKLEKHGVDCQPKASTIRIIQVFFQILSSTEE